MAGGKAQVFGLMELLIAVGLSEAVAGGKALKHLD